MTESLSRFEGELLASWIPTDGAVGDAEPGPHASAELPVEAPQGPRPLYSGPVASTAVGWRSGRTRRAGQPERSCAHSAT